MADESPSEVPAPSSDSLARLPGRPVANDEAVGAALARVERSSTLRHSAQLRRLLRHLVEHAQRGEANALCEIAVGVAALGRDATSFDPKRDPIVRTEARRLRAKLAEYYAGEGRDDPIVIEVPKGGYVPVLHAAPFRGTIDDASVVVLPFANLTGDAAREAFCDALTDELIDALARIPSLRVVARTSAFRYKESRADVRSIGSALHVATLVEGSVQIAGERVRVLAQLVTCRDGCHLWSQAFEAASADLPLVQAALAGEIARSLERAGALPPGRRPAAAPGTRDATARDRYERALEIVRRLDAARHDRAAELLDEALARDPGFAAAHHLAAVVLANRVSICAAPSAEAMPRALAHLARALEREPALAPARALLAWIAGVWDRDWVRSGAELDRALRDGPGSFPVRNTAGNLLALQGRFDEAEAEFALARELDPFHLAPRYNAALVAGYARRFDLGIARCEAILDVEPAHPAAALRIALLVAARREAEALDAALRYASDRPGSAFAVARLAETRAACGGLDEGLRMLDDAHVTLASAGAAHWARAHVHAAAGDAEGSLAELELACAARESNTEATAVDPYFAFLHDDPRWPALVARHRLPRVARARPCPLPA